MIQCMNTLRKNAGIVYDGDYKEIVDKFCSGEKIDYKNKFNTLLLEGREILELLSFSDKLKDYGDRIKKDIIEKINKTKRAKPKKKSEEE